MFTFFNVNDVYFINVACIGIDAEVANNKDKFKKKFIDMMDGELIYEHPKKVSFTLDTKSRNKLIQDLIDTVTSAKRKVDVHMSNLKVADAIGLISSDRIVYRGY